MPTTVTVTKTLYQFSELDDSAKERARNWWRESMDSSDYSDSVITDAQTVAELLGIEFDTRPIRLMGGGTRQEPKVYWSGFSSQGDGASFEGVYRYNKGAQVSSHVGNSDSCQEVLRIERELKAIQKRHFYQIRARVTTSGRYSHSNTMSAEVYRNDDRDVSLEDQDAVEQLMRDFADWIYKGLEAEYDYQSSNEQIDETMDANSYTFDEFGSRED